MRLFVYGTLCDPDVRNEVLGGWKGHIFSASLRGHLALEVGSERYPALYPRAVGCATGLILSGINFQTLTRVSHYEGKEYRILLREPLTVGQGPVSALVYVARRYVKRNRRFWKLQEWQRRHKSKSLPIIKEWMGLWYKDNPKDVRDLTSVCRRF